MFVCEEKGAIFMLLLFVMLFFSNSELNTKSFSCQTNRIWKNDFIDNIYNANLFPSSMLKIDLCTSRRTQLQQTFIDECLFCYFELSLFVCIDVLRRCNIFAVMTRRFPVHLG